MDISDKLPKLYDLIKMDDPEEVLNETKKIISMMYKTFNYNTYGLAFEDTINLFNGKYPGYRACNTQYHDLTHTINTLLATARLIHGYSVKNGVLPEDTVLMALIAALFHDAGYIQKIGDKKGTGGRYTYNHVQRSVKFAKAYLSQKGFSENFIKDCMDTIKCTTLEKNILHMRFSSENGKLMGKILGTADLIGQMADRNYLEKLTYLYREFIEGKITYFENEFDLLKNTVSFFESVKERLEKHLGGMYKYMVYHFKVRWGIDEDLYQLAIKKNIEYLYKILNDRPEEYYKYLKRGNILTTNKYK